jgi:tetratricopeptide (TPR) repeat protein
MLRTRARFSRIVVAPLTLLLPLAPCTAERQNAPAEDLGAVDFAVSCELDEPDAFDRAVALLHHMTYPQARQAFEEIAAHDPECAMAHWGIAMTLFQPLWPTRPTPADLARGVEEVRAAAQIGEADQREQLFIAMAAAFHDSTAADYWTRIAQWEEAAKRLYDAFPEDEDAAAFYALAHLATAPPTGDTGHHERAAGILATVLEQNPTHPGAVHYTIHANDATGRERFSPDVVKRYLEIAPRNPHALHMPTHIFVRRGEWTDVIEWNRAAAQAALQHPAGDHGQWVWDELPHALEYMAYAQLQQGDDSAAAHTLEQLTAVTNLQPGFKTAFHLSSIPARYALERKAWTEAAALQPRADSTLQWDLFTWPEAITWFARGLGAARGGNLAAATAAGTKLDELGRAAQDSGEELFARNIEILRLELQAWLAHAHRRDDDAVRLMRSAAALEAATPKHAVTPAPTLPADELLGDLLLDMGRATDALDAYRNALRNAPRRFNSLAGAVRAALAAGDTAAAENYSNDLLDQVVPASRRPDIAEFTTFLQSRSAGR